jgi:GT2 family glycosyltransferase
VKLVTLAENRGFAGGNNAGAAKRVAGSSLSQ